MTDSAAWAGDADGPSDLDALRSMNLAFDLSPLAIMVIDDALHVVDANPAAHRMLGGDAVIGSSVLAFAVADNVARAERENKLWLSGELTHLERETDLVSGTGETLRAAIQLDALVLPSGRRYFLAQLLDVTADRRRARELAAGEQQYRQLVDNLPDSSVMLFDRDLRLIVAAGEAMAASGYSDDLSGKLMRDVFPAESMDLVEGHYRAALAGRATDFAYTSPVGGRQYRVRARPVLNTAGKVVGGFSMTEDVTAERANATQLDQIQQFHHFGGSSYDRNSGWSYSDNLLGLWGIKEGPTDPGLPFGMLAPAERDAGAHKWSKVLTEDGRHGLSYNVIHGMTGEVRYLQCTAASVVDAAGVLMSVVATHVDVSDAVLASRQAELKQMAAARERSGLVCQVGDMLATSRLKPDELLHSIVDFASSTLGEGAAIRILSADGRTIERDVIAHPDESVRLRLGASLRRSAQEPIAGDGILAQVVRKGKLLTDFRQREWLPEYQRIFTERVYDQAAHVMVAPVRHNGIVLGKLAVFRTDPGAPYELGDDDVLQVLADGAGTAIAENRTWQLANRKRDQQLAELRKGHVELLEQLSGMETRERSRLAEAIHDEPIQRMVASVLRLELLGSRLDATSRDEVDEVTEQLVATVDWLRDLIVVALKPPALTDGLGLALAGLARGIFTATPTVFVLAEESHVPLSAPAQDAVYRILREALVNIRNHANAATVTLRLEERDGLVLIGLTDDGNGSADLNVETGHLGIAAMRARAQAEGWLLAIESVPGVGTTVTLTLPGPTAPDAGDTVSASHLGHTGLDDLHTVVVCDDHQYLRDVVTRVLSTVRGFRIVGEASDGETCLQQVRESRPDVLMLDVSMPGGGPDLARAAKELVPGMHVVVFSGREDEETRNAMMAAGADQYIVKTGRLQPLVDALDRAIAFTRA